MSNIMENDYRKTPVSVLAIIAVICHALFMMNRLKFSQLIEIDGAAVNNESWLFLMVIIFKIWIDQMDATYVVEKRIIHDRVLLILIILLFIVAICGGLGAQDLSQYIYATLLFFVPILFLFSVSRKNSDYFEYFIKLFIILSFIYSIIVVIAVNNFGYIMELLGNSTDVQQYSQYRASLMLGSSITVSYYLNISLPLCFYHVFTTENKKWRIFDTVAIVINLIATAINLSRLAFIVSIFIVLYCLFFVKQGRFSFQKKIGVSVLIVVSIWYTATSFDLDRLFYGFSDDSTLERAYAMNLGVFLFKENPVLGTGLGKYFVRAASGREISVAGINGLVDPHNTVVMALSEMGISGFTLLCIILMRIVKIFSYIENVEFRRTSYIVLCSYLLGALGGSQLFNEMSFSTILWIYLSLFVAVGSRDRNLRAWGGVD